MAIQVSATGIFIRQKCVRAVNKNGGVGYALGYSGCSYTSPGGANAGKKVHAVVYEMARPPGRGSIHLLVASFMCRGFSRCAPCALK